VNWEITVQGTFSWGIFTSSYTRGFMWVCECVREREIVCVFMCVRERDIVCEREREKECVCVFTWCVWLYLDTHVVPVQQSVHLCRRMYVLRPKRLVLFTCQPTVTHTHTHTHTHAHTHYHTHSCKRVHISKASFVEPTNEFPWKSTSSVSQLTMPSSIYLYSFHSSPQKYSKLKIL
jgi:hypothetical protein